MVSMTDSMNVQAMNAIHKLEFMKFDIEFISKCF